MLTINLIQFKRNSAHYYLLVNIVHSEDLQNPHNHFN